MNCEWVKTNVTLYAYDELTDDARFELEQHCARCADCATELKAVQGFRNAMSAMPVLEPTPSLLAASRMRLQEALESAEQERGWRRWFFDPTAFLRQVRFSPALAAVLLMVGFAGGIGATWQIARSGNPIVQPSNGNTVTPVAQEASVASIRDIVQQPGSNKVEIKYDSLVPQSVEGNLSDPRIQQLLLFAARNNSNSGVRMESVNLLTQQPEDAAVREALKSALRYDSNPGVRIKALESLAPYVKDDVSVRDVVLEALLHDSNPGVRAEAIHMLQPVKADGSVRQALEHLSQQDKDTYIRRQSRAVLASVPEID